MIPKTADGRVLFAIPWHGATLVGTTDEAVEHARVSRVRWSRRDSFLFDHIERYFGRDRPEEILSMWSGLRPLVRKGHGKTSKLSRDHTILVSATGLVTVTGGKWTTYRRMGEDAIDQAAEVAGLPKVKFADARPEVAWMDRPSGGRAPSRIECTELICHRFNSCQCADPSSEKLLHPRLPYRAGEVVWAARYEMARTVEDVLARRTRALFLDARAAIEAAPVVADCWRKSLGEMRPASGIRRVFKQSREAMFIWEND